MFKATRHFLLHSTDLDDFFGEWFGDLLEKLFVRLWIVLDVHHVVHEPVRESEERACINSYSATATAQTKLLQVQKIRPKQKSSRSTTKNVNTFVSSNFAPFSCLTFTSDALHDGLDGQQDGDAEPVEHVVHRGAAERAAELVLIAGLCERDDGVGDRRTNVGAHDDEHSLFGWDNCKRQVPGVSLNYSRELDQVWREGKLQVCRRIL